MIKQPNSSHCFVCGVANVYGLHMEFYFTNPGEVVSDFVVPAHFQGYPGIVHGGVIAAMLDEIAGRAFMVDDPPRFLVTARLSIRYRKPVPVATPLRLVGKAGRDNGQVANATGSIFDPEGTLLAEAEALLVNVPDKMMASLDPERLGWRVYNDEESRK